MEPELFRQEFNKIFKRFSSEFSPSLLQSELDFYKRFWNFFILGDSFYFILNHHSLEFEVVSKEIENVLGYTPFECTVQFLRDKLHPEDYSYFLTFGKCMIEFFSQIPLDKLTKYKLRHDLRYKKKNGDYACILYQGLIIEHDENGGLLRSIGVNSDITYLKQQGRPLLSFIGMEGEPSFVDVAAKDSFFENKEEFTKREKQILTLLIEGKLSKEISCVLNISKQTVDTHRKNMLHKKNLNNTSELIGKAIRYGWI